jgi:hypothetical protein
MPMTTRRALLVGASALAAASPLRAAQPAASAERSFAVLRGDSDIGRHRVALTRQGADLNLDVDVDIVVRVLGVAVYRYEMRNREVWRDGLLQSIDCTVNDDGTRKAVRAARSGDVIEIDATAYSGTAPGDAATTTYFTPDFLQRRTWISTDDGAPMTVSAVERGPTTVAAAGGVSATTWRVSDGAAFDVELHYDARDEWVSIGFDARGTPAVYRPDRLDDSFAAVWRG